MGRAPLALCNLSAIFRLLSEVHALPSLLGQALVSDGAPAFSRSAAAADPAVSAPRRFRIYVIVSRRVGLQAAALRPISVEDVLLPKELLRGREGKLRLRAI